MLSQPTFNFFTLIIAAGVFQGLVFVLLPVLIKKYKTKAHRYLAAGVLFLSLSNLQYLLTETKIITPEVFLKFVYVPWQFLVPVMFLYFIHEYFNIKKVNKLFLIPFFLILILRLVQLFGIITDSFQLSFEANKLMFTLVDISSFVYFGFIIYRFWLISERHTDTTSQPIVLKGWIKNLIIIAIIISFIWLVGIVLDVILGLDENYVFYPLWILISGFIYWVAYVCLIQYNLLSERLKIRNSNLAPTKEKSKNTPEISNKHYNNFCKLLEDEKLYLNPTLNLELMADKLNVSITTLSQNINKVSNKNFSQLINEYRIAYAKEMLLSDDYKQYTIVSIGLESGFYSKSAFYTAFKKQVGHTPTEYRKLRMS